MDNNFALSSPPRWLALILIKREHSKCEHDPCLTKEAPTLISKYVRERLVLFFPRRHTLVEKCLHRWNAHREVKGEPRTAGSRWPSETRQDSM
jgi:hypothetical protein